MFKDIFLEIILLFNEMALYLMIGFLFAGILHIFLSTKFIAKHLGKNDFFSVIKAALFGVPLPLCSCGVIPAAFQLKKQGAGNGSVLAFLVSTPTTGVDSILATYALLGPFFAFYRMITAFISGVISGLLTNLFLGENEKNTRRIIETDDIAQNNLSFIDKIKEMFNYAFFNLLNDIKKWLLIGIVIGGIITYAIPGDFFNEYLGNGFLSMFVMLIVGIPMYVCSTGSIPIAAALMLKGLNPGAAFVFLLSGPATNTVTLTVIAKQLGKKALFIYLISIIFSSIFFGYLLNHYYYLNNFKIFYHHHHINNFLRYLKIVASLSLLYFMLFPLIKKYWNKIFVQKKNLIKTEYFSENLNCINCANSMITKIKQKYSIDRVEINLKEKKLILFSKNKIDYNELKIFLDK